MRYTTFKNILGNTCLFDNKEGQGTIFIGKEFEATFLADRLNELHSELSTAQATIEAQAKALADVHGFLRSTFPLENPSDVRYFNQYAAEMIAKWDASVADTTPNENESAE